MLDSAIHTGILVTSIFGTLNFISCSSLLFLIIYHRYISNWKTLQSQNITLLTNLLASDVIQSFGFIIGYRWYSLNDIVAPSTTCSTQAFFIQMADLSTALFVTSIALHTLLHFLRPTDPRLPDRWFRLCIVCIWVVTFAIALVPEIIGNNFYADAGVWCWINKEHSWPRLYLHYLWLLLAQTLSIAIYMGLGMRLWFYGTKNGSLELKRAAKMMIMYPITYTVGTLPLAIVRLASMAGHDAGVTYVTVVCIIFSSLGGVNCMVYMSTRRGIVRRELESRARSQSGSVKRRVTRNSMLARTASTVNSPSIAEPVMADTYTKYQQADRDLFCDDPIFEEV